MKAPNPNIALHAGRIIVAVVLLAQTACSQLTLPPGDGTSLAERRRMLDEDPAAGITVIPRRRAEEAAAPATADGNNATDSQDPGELSPPSGRSMSDAKKLSSPDLGIRIPIGQPALTPRQYSPQE